MKGNKTLHVKLPVFGFMHMGLVHYWDILNKRAIVFKYPYRIHPENESSITTATYPQKVTIVPLSQYMVCSSEVGESDEESAEQGEVAGQEEGLEKKRISG